jgi:hypothetical protein
VIFKRSRKVHQLGVLSLAISEAEKFNRSGQGEVKNNGRSFSAQSRSGGCLVDWFKIMHVCKSSRL